MEYLLIGLVALGTVFVGYVFWKLSFAGSGPGD